MSRLIKIAIVGPESTGKSNLSAELAKHFHCSYVPEVAREYLEHLGKQYEENDLLKIGQQQMLVEDHLAENSNSLLICDTTLLVIKIWSEVKYGHCDSWIIDEEKLRNYDLFLLTDIDLPWIDDPQREHPHLREHLFRLYFKELAEKEAKFEVISGIGATRLANALKAMEKHFPVLFESYT